MPKSGARPTLGQLLCSLLLLTFVAHRVAVIFSAGDFLYPLEPSEAKNTQIAWDLMSGRFGEDGFGLGAYVANSGSIHHGSYSSAALAYWVTSWVTGFGLFSVRFVPLLFWTVALWLWLDLLRRRIGSVAALGAGLGLTLVPTLFIGFQLTFLGCHPESVLPLAALIFAWMYWQRDDIEDRRVPAALLGAAAGYSLIFSYLLWPFVALIAALSLLPPLPRPGRRELVGLGLGLIAGLWPFWLIMALEGPAALFASNITERSDTTMLDMALRRGAEAGDLFRTFTDNLPRFGMDLPDPEAGGCGKFKDYWMCQAQAGDLWGGINFEPLAYRILVFGPLLLLPAALLERGAALRRLLLLVAIAPALNYGFLAYANPWRGDASIPVRYFVPLAFLGFSAPGIAAGLGLRALREARQEMDSRVLSFLRRGLGLLLLVAGIGTLAWLTPPRLTEARDLVRLERAAALAEHRYVTYYNLGIGTVWADMVDEVNDLIDYRAAEGRSDAFHGFQAGLWGSGRRLGLGEGDWNPEPLGWGSLNAGIREWLERDSYRPKEQRENALYVAQNVGWGAGLRTDWDPALVAEVLQQGQDAGEWPAELSLDLVWAGFGTGWVRARPDAIAPGQTLPASIPEAYHEAVSRGLTRGRSAGAVPVAPTGPIFESVRGPAT